MEQQAGLQLEFGAEIGQAVVNFPGPLVGEVACEFDATHSVERAQEVARA